MCDCHTLPKEKRCKYPRETQCHSCSKIMHSVSYPYCSPSCIEDGFNNRDKPKICKCFYCTHLLSPNVDEDEDWEFEK